MGGDREYGGCRGRPSEAGGTTPQGAVPATTDSGEYREGTVKSTPARGVKEILKPRTRKQSGAIGVSQAEGVPIEE